MKHHWCYRFRWPFEDTAQRPATVFVFHQVVPSWKTSNLKFSSTDHNLVHVRSAWRNTEYYMDVRGKKGNLFRVSEVNEWDILVNTRNKFHISKHLCTVHWFETTFCSRENFNSKIVNCCFNILENIIEFDSIRNTVKQLKYCYEQSRPNRKIFMFLCGSRNKNISL